MVGGICGATYIGTTAWCSWLDAEMCQCSYYGDFTSKKQLINKTRLNTIKPQSQQNKLLPSTHYSLAYTFGYSVVQHIMFI